MHAVLRNPPAARGTRWISSTRTITVGKSKTDSGTGRVIPLNTRAHRPFWSSGRATFRTGNPLHYVFPSERYGAAGDNFKACAYDTDPTKPIGRWKEAWEAAKNRAKVQCRFHDLRHTGCTRMLEAGVTISRARNDNGLESGNHSPYGEALRTHRTQGPENRS